MYHPSKSCLNSSAHGFSGGQQPTLRTSKVWRLHGPTGSLELCKIYTAWEKEGRIRCPMTACMVHLNAAGWASPGPATWKNPEGVLYDIETQEAKLLQDLRASMYASKWKHAESGYNTEGLGTDPCFKIIHRACKLLEKGNEFGISCTAMCGSWRQHYGGKGKLQQILRPLWC